MDFIGPGEVFSAVSFVTDSISDFSFSTKESKLLAIRCTDIINFIQQCDSELQKDYTVRRLINTVIKCLKFCKEYDKKWKITRFVFQYSSDFEKYHRRLSQDFNDLTNSLTIEFLLIKSKSIQDEIEDYKQSNEKHKLQRLTSFTDVL